MGLITRVWNARLSRYLPGRQSNCIGTALYICGILPKDTCMTSTQADRYLGEELKEPRENCILAFKNVRGDLTEKYYHMAVVLKIKPSVRLVHRQGVDGPIKNNVLLEKLIEKYQYAQPLFYASTPLMR
jgi:hypothetical protein